MRIRAKGHQVHESLHSILTGTHALRPLPKMRENGVIQIQHYKKCGANISRISNITFIHERISKDKIAAFHIPLTKSDIFRGEILQNGIIPVISLHYSHKFKGFAIFIFRNTF